MYEGKLQESHFLPVLLTVFGASGSAADGNSGGVCTGSRSENTRQSAIGKKQVISSVIIKFFKTVREKRINS